MKAATHSHPPVQSMTGFGSEEGPIGGIRHRVEIKALNHRYLDVKLRIPRELSSAESALRALVQGKFTRGSIELKVERIATPEHDGKLRHSIQPNIALARAYYDALCEIQGALELGDKIKTVTIASMPDVLTRSTGDLNAEEATTELTPLVQQALYALAEMRVTEGRALTKVLLGAASELEAKLDFLRKRRAEVAGKYPEKIREKIRAIFEAHPVSEGNIQALLESRIAQELALAADRTDIEEELVRFKGHLDHLRKILHEGGQVGRKLEFILQELGREINTLGNKAQDYGMSEEVVQIKVRLEQIREQIMNLE